MDKRSFYRWRLSILSFRYRSLDDEWIAIGRRICFLFSIVEDVCEPVFSFDLSRRLCVMVIGDFTSRLSNEEIIRVNSSCTCKIRVNE